VVKTTTDEIILYLSNDGHQNEIKGDKKEHGEALFNQVIIQLLRGVRIMDKKSAIDREGNCDGGGS
jgi:hypothetical protein